MKNANITLKGDALICAVEAGLVQEAKTADGYNIAPFLRFWEAFSPLLDQALKEPQNIPKVFHAVPM